MSARPFVYLFVYRGLGGCLRVRRLVGLSLQGLDLQALIGQTCKDYLQKVGYRVGVNKRPS